MKFEVRDSIKKGKKKKDERVDLLDSRI